MIKAKRQCNRYALLQTHSKGMKKMETLQILSLSELEYRRLVILVGLPYKVCSRGLILLGCGLHQR